jgi:hypothetical protein
LIWVARGIWLLALVAATASALLGLLIPGIYAAIGDDEVGGPVLFATIGVVGATYATGGILILRQRVRHAVGWILLVAGALISSEFLLFAIGFDRASANDPAGVWLVLVSGAMFWPMLLLAGPALALYFPDGRLPDRRWRAPILAGAALIGLSIILGLLQPGSVDPESGLPPNPIGWNVLPRGLFEAVEATSFVVIIAAVGVAIGSVIVRYRRASTDERHQLKWFVFAVTIWAVLLPVSLYGSSIILASVSLATLILLPAAILVAITRYRLYEIDTLINRTLVYVPLVGIVAGFYAASVALLQRVFVAFTGNTSDGAAVISALILAAIFTPVRKSIEGFVDRRFKPLPADAPAEELPGVTLNDPAFVSAVERVVIDVLARRSEPLQGGARGRTPSLK